jgi:hypothetical protein
VGNGLDKRYSRPAHVRDLSTYLTNPLSPNDMEDAWGVDIDSRACRTLPCGCLEARGSGRAMAIEIAIEIAIAIRVAIAISIVIVFGYQKTARTPHLIPPRSCVPRRPRA